MGAPATFPGRAKPEPGTQRGASRLGGRVKPGHDGHMGAHLAVLPAKAGIHGRPQGRSVGLSWMPTFVGMTLGDNGRL